jgi:hypothetical protein
MGLIVTVPSLNSLFRVTDWQQSGVSLRRSRSHRTSCFQPTKNCLCVRPNPLLRYSEPDVHLFITPKWKHELLIQNP